MVWNIKNLVKNFCEAMSENYMMQKNGQLVRGLSQTSRQYG